MNTQSTIFKSAFGALVIFVMLMVPGKGWGQQVIGAFPNTDGGFEGQINGTIVTVSSIATGVQRTDWTVSAGSGAALITGAGGRSGPKYLTVEATSTTARRYQSPTAASTAMANATAFTVQYFYKTAGSITFSNGQVGNSPDGTAQPGTYASITMLGTSGGWTKVQVSQSSGTSSNTPRYGLSIFRISSTSNVAADIDDFVVYAGAADNTAPNSPGTVTVDGATQTSLNVSWVAASGGVDGGGYVVVRYTTDPGTGNDPNQNGIYAIENTIPTGGIVRYIGTGTSFTDNSGLSAGTQYWYKVYTVDKAFNYSDETVGSGSTTSPSGSTSSDIIGAGNEVSNIAYANYQASSIGTISEAVRLFSFTIRDGGGSADGDGLPTILTSITFDKGTNNGVTSWANTIREAALFDGSTKIAEVSVSGETIIFTSLSGPNVTAPDDGSKSLDLYLTFESSVTDNQQFHFQITNGNVTNAVSGSSSFTAFSAVSSSVTGDANKIEVTATKLAFVQQPTNAAINTAISPAVTVAANDANNNRDLDYITDNSVTATGATLTGSPVTSTPSSGLASFSSLTFTTTGSGVTLNATSGSLTSATSSTFDISQPPVAGEIVINQFNPAYGVASDEYVELLNKTNKTFDLSLLEIEYRAAATGNPGSAGGNLSGTLGPYQYWLLSPNATITVGETSSLARDGAITAGFSASAGQLAIRLIDAPKTIIDGLAYGSVTVNVVGEGSPASSPPTDGGLIRTPDGFDADENSTDFTTVANADIYLRNQNSYNISGSYTLPSTSYTADIVISGSSTAAALTGNTTIAGKLTILAGALTIASNQNLTISGTLTNFAGASGLVIKSDASGTGSLIHSTVDIDGTVERYMNNADWADWQDGWHFLGSPVAAQAVSPNFTSDPYDFYCWYEPTNQWVNFKNTTTSPTWNDANGSTDFSVGKGYMAAYDDAAVKTFSGTLNVSDVAVSGLAITGTTLASRGMHLLGNPFGSAVTWDASAAWSLTNIGGVAKIWNESLQSYSDLTSSPATVIPATNGFMVQASGGTGSLTIPAAKRVHSSQAFYKAAVPQVKLTARNIAVGNAQESSVCFNPEATTGFDLMFDGEFLAGFGPTFYSGSGDLKLSTNSLPDLSSQTAIPFTFIPNAGTAFRIEASGLETVMANTWLLDKKTSTDHNLSLDPVYQFTASTDDDPARFLLHFKGVGIGEPVGKQPAVSVYSANNEIFISNRSGAALTGNAYVYNMMGQCVMQQKLNGDIMTKINLNAGTGYYLVKVVTGENTYTAKVFIMK